MKYIDIYNRINKDGKAGGYVVPMPDMTTKQLNNDSVQTILLPGELVIPRKYVHTVMGFLKRKNIRFGNLR